MNSKLIEKAALNTYPAPFFHGMGVEPYYGDWKGLAEVCMEAAAKGNSWESIAQSIGEELFMSKSDSIGPDSIEVVRDSAEKLLRLLIMYSGVDTSSTFLSINLEPTEINFLRARYIAECYRMEYCEHADKYHFETGQALYENDMPSKNGSLINRMSSLANGTSVDPSGKCERGTSITNAPSADNGNVLHNRDLPVRDYTHYQTSSFSGK